jgi:hypothetical protein
VGTLLAKTPGLGQKLPLYSSAYAIAAAALLLADLLLSSRLQLAAHQVSKRHVELLHLSSRRSRRWSINMFTNTLAGTGNHRFPPQITKAVLAAGSLKPAGNRTPR